MALFEVFIPGKEAGLPNVTLTLEAQNWIGALRSGLKSIGEGQEAIANVMCDIKEDNSIHVTDVATRRVFRLREVPKKAEPPRPISIPEGAPVADDTVRNERPPDVAAAAAPPAAPFAAAAESPKTMIEFPAPKFETTQALSPAAPMPAPMAAPAPLVTKPSLDADSSVPWTTMPAPSPSSIPDPRKMVSPSAPAPAPRAPAPTPAPVTVAETPRPATIPPPAAAAPARPIPASDDATVPLPVAQRAPEAAAPPTVPVPKPSSPTPVAKGRTTSSPSSLPLGPPTPRGVPAPAPKRPSGQFSQAPAPVTREESKANPKTDPLIGRPREPDKKSVDVQEAIAAVFDATQDLYMETSLSAQHVADKLLDIALAHIPAESGTFYLADVNGHELTFAAVRGPRADALKRSGMTVPVGQGIIGFCAQEGVCLAVSDIQKDPRFLASIAKSIDYQPTDTLCASAEKDGRLFGAVQLINSQTGFDAAHMEVLRFIGLTAAAMLERVAEAS